MVAPDIVPPRNSSAAVRASHAVDRAALQRLASDVGDHTARDMCRLYLADLPSRIAAMRSAFDSGDAPALAQAAHALASASRLLGASFLADMCVDLDRRARAGRLDDGAAATFGMVTVTASRTAQELQRFTETPADE